MTIDTSVDLVIEDNARWLGKCVKHLLTGDSPDAMRWTEQDRREAQHLVLSTARDAYFAGEMQAQPSHSPMAKDGNWACLLLQDTAGATLMATEPGNGEVEYHLFAPGRLPVFLGRSNRP